MDSPEEVRMLVRRALEESGIGRSQIARDAGLSRAALNAWTAEGRAARSPRRDSLHQLAAGFRNRADRLRELADELDAAAGEGAAE